MTSKLKGSRLEAEVDKCRGECNWTRLNELLPSIRSKNSGVDKLCDLVEGELTLETFLERQGEHIRPKRQHADFLRTAENLLKSAIEENRNERTVVMEGFLLLAKLHYFSANYAETLQDVDNSKLDAPKTQFETLRSLKLAAEGYAIKGLAIEHTIRKDRDKYYDLSRKRMLNCFETSAELTISYIAELEKVMNSSKPGSVVIASSSSSSSTSTAGKLTSLKLGELLEEALERAPYLSLRKNGTEKRWDADGIEWYRRIMTQLSDKSTAEKVQQRLCCQLAEVLLRGMLESGYDASSDNSRAIYSKAESLNFYTGSKRNYFSPSSRLEEVVLLLLIGEVLASRNVRTINGHDGLERAAAIRSLKMVQNLLSIVLSNLRQYQLLSSIYDRSMWLSNGDRHNWFQFGLALTCSGRLSRATKVLQHSVAQSEARDLGEGTEYMFIARSHIEQLGDASIALEAASKALQAHSGSWLRGRCMLLYALAYSMKTQAEVSFDVRTSMLEESVQNFERAVLYDPHDELSQLYSALEYAIARDLDSAQEQCQRSLEINPEQPSAIMLMSLIFTARKDNKSALQLVLGALEEFPNHYGLLVLRLKLESKYGRIEESLNTSKHLLRFWRKTPPTYPGDYFSDEDSTIQPQQNGHADGIKANNSLLQLNSRDALMPVTPIFTAPLGISTASHISLSTSACDVTGEPVDRLF